MNDFRKMLFQFHPDSVKILKCEISIHQCFGQSFFGTLSIAVYILNSRLVFFQPMRLFGGVEPTPVFPQGPGGPPHPVPPMGGAAGGGPPTWIPPGAVAPQLRCPPHPGFVTGNPSGFQMSLPPAPNSHPPPPAQQPNNQTHAATNGSSASTVPPPNSKLKIITPPNDGNGNAVSFAH